MPENAGRYFPRCAPKNDAISPNASLLSGTVSLNPPQSRGEVELLNIPPAKYGPYLAHFTTMFWVRNAALAQVFRQGTGDAEIGEEWALRQSTRYGLAVGLLKTWPDSAFRAGVTRDELDDRGREHDRDGQHHVRVVEQASSSGAGEARALSREDRWCFHAYRVGTGGPGVDGPK